MFKEIGQMFSLLKAAPKIKEEMQKLQNRLGELIAEGDAGAGMVKVKVNGRMEILACSISDDALRMNDREMLEEFVKGATNQAMDKVRKLVAEESTKIAGGLGLPGMPDMSGLMGSGS